jgi:hypothetical protein
VTAAPNLFLVGAAKAGTTTLAAQLGRHPEVFVCTPKEPSYFSAATDLPGEGGAKGVFVGYDHALTWDDYLSRFSGGEESKWRLDASTAYLQHPDAAKRIAMRIPEPRFLAILREPAGRAYSHWAFWAQFGFEHLGFDDALTAELAGTPLRNGVERRYLARSRYAAGLARYLDNFGSASMLLLDHADLRHEPERLYDQVFTFLEVDPVELDAGRALNASSSPRSHTIERLVRRADRRIRQANPSHRRVRQLQALARRTVRVAARANRRPVPPMLSSSRQRVLELLEADIREVDHIVPWDALRWLEVR